MIKIKPIKAKDLNKELTNQLINIYKQENWWKNENPKKLKTIVKNSRIFVVAEENRKILAMGRVISDNVSDAYIQDLAVLKTYQGKGLGKTILDFILKKIKKDFSFIALIAQNNTSGFYKKIGFKKMKNSAPMIYGKF